MLQARGLQVPADAITRVRGTRDEPTLEARFRRAVTCTAVDDLFE